MRDGNYKERENGRREKKEKGEGDSSPNYSEEKFKTGISHIHPQSGRRAVRRLQ